MSGAFGVLVWRFAEPRLCISSAPLGGGLGLRSWVMNAQVPSDYARDDVADHLTEIADAHGCTGRGVAMCTAAAVERVREERDGDAVARATVGIRYPTWAADAEAAFTSWHAGTINVFVDLDRRLSDAALVNAVVTVTEAKAQALIEAGIPGTGTASDAVCIACPAEGPAETFGGPRSAVGSSLARAVHAAVTLGIGRATP